MVNPPNNNAEEVPPLIGGITVVATKIDAIPGSQGTTAIPTTTVSTKIPSETVSMATPSNSQSVPIVSSEVIQWKPFTPRPYGFNVSRPFTPWFSIPMRDHPYGMSISFMADLHNNTSMYMKPLATTFSPVHGSGSVVNLLNLNIRLPEFANQLPLLTINPFAILRQQIDESNHEMV